MLKHAAEKIVYGVIPSEARNDDVLSVSATC